MKDAIKRVQEQITSACNRAGRDPSEVLLLAVTKNHQREAVVRARDAGLALFGENRVQEALAKYDGVEGVRLHLIGHLQSNKARFVPGAFHCVESIDSIKIAQALSRHALEVKKRLDILLQLNSSGEHTKSGFSSGDELLEAAEVIHQLPNLTIAGVMTIGPFTEDGHRVSAAFARTRETFERLRKALPSPELSVLSMGMTDDMEIAIAEGSTEVRIGTALFGART